MNKLTMQQLLLAAGLARGMNKVSLCNHVNCTEAYLYKLLKDQDFKNLILQFKGADPDQDNLKFKNIGSLYMDVGKFIYNHGLKTINGEN